MLLKLKPFKKPMTLLLFHVSETLMEPSWDQSRHSSKEFQKHGKVTKSYVFKWFALQKYQQSQKVMGFWRAWSFQASQDFTNLKMWEAWTLQTIQKPTTLWFFWCFWSSDHSKTYDFVTFSCFWNSYGAIVRPEQAWFQRVSETWKSHTVIGV